MLVEPLRASDAKKLIRAIFAKGGVAFSRHSQEELANDGLTIQDAENVLRAGIVDEAEYENGGWRYRVRTPRMVVVIAFRSEDELKVITGWRLK